MTSPAVRVGAPARRSPGSARAVVGVVATMVSVSTPPFLTGTVAIQIAATMPFSPGQLGAAVAGYYVVSAMFSPLAGSLVGRLGPALALRLACLGATGGLVALALAPSALAVVVALSLLGLPNALVQPAANQVLSDTVPAHRQGLAFGLVQSAIPSATLLSGALLAVFGTGGHWRAAAWSVVVFTLVAQLLIAPTRPADRRDAVGPAAPAALLPPPLGGGLLMVGLVLAAVLGAAAASNLPSFVASTGAERGLAPSEVAAVQVVASLSCIGLRVLAAWRGSLLPGWRVLGGVAALLLVGTAGYALLAAPSQLAFCVGVVIAYAFGWGWNGLFNLSVARARAGRVSAATGFTQGGVFLGGVIGPLLFAVVLDAHGLGAAWSVLAAGALGASLSIVVAARLWAGAGRVEVA